MIIIFIWMSLTLFGSTQAASFQCKFSTSSWGLGTLNTIYWCDVQNYVSITSSDTAQVDSISGTHLPGKNNDYVDAIQVLTKGQIYYFPRGLNNFFKNLKKIRIESNGLKELHQSDLKDFPRLVVLWLFNNNLEIIEENLFKFNPNLEWISLWSNKIQHIDSNVFNKLTKFKTLWLNDNTCIDMAAVNNPTAVQNVVKTARAQCISSDYLNLEQKVKNLEMESKNLNSENFKEKLEKLENSKFSNFFQKNLKDLKAAQIEKARKEFVDAISAIGKNNSIEVCSALESKVNDGIDKLMVQGLKITRIEENMTKISDAIEMINKNYEDLNTKFTNLMNALEIVFSAGRKGT